MLRPLLLALTLVCLLGACDRTATSAAPTAAPVAAEPGRRAQQLQALYADYWEAYLALNPLRATLYGDNRFNDQWADAGSADHRAQVHALEARGLAQAEAIGSAGLTGQDQLSYEIFVRDRRQALQAERFPQWMLPVSQMDSTAGYAVMFGSGAGAQPFATVQDHDHWLARAARVPVLVSTEIDNMRQGLRAGVVQPRVVVEKVLAQLDAVLTPEVETSPFWGPVQLLPDTISGADRQRLTQAYRTLITGQLNPALRRQRDFLASEYLPQARATVGLAALPQGTAWYAFNVQRETTTQQTPAQIHQIGLDEVARIHQQLRGVMAELGFQGSLQEFFAFMQHDRRFEFASEKAMLAHYARLEATVAAGIPRLFSLKPRAGFVVRAIEPARAPSSPSGGYLPPSEDGSRRGTFYVNTYALPTRRTWDAEPLFLHEAVPGHHFQLALQQELTDVPAFRRFGQQTAFVEGWALYAEGLGKELGLYRDPYDQAGRLQGELWRAIRLVVDTGLHSQGWSRQQVLDYMFANAATGEPDAVAEAERYIAWPGQALAYKTGELKILQLRARAQQALGERFDIRRFHAEVLKDGAVPLDVLDARMVRWIAAQR